MSQLDLLSVTASTGDTDSSEMPASHLVPVALKSGGAYRTIREVSDELGVPQHVLRFWESHFPQVRPSRMRGSRRYYRPEDIELLKTIKTLLYGKGYTIKGAKKLVRDGQALEVTEIPVHAKHAQMHTARKLRDTVENAFDRLALIVELRDLQSILASAL